MTGSWDGNNMTLIDTKYQQQLNRMHAKGKFNNGAKAYKIVEKFIKQYRPTSVLDFGCGKGALIAGINSSHPAISTQGYDPGNPDFEVLPIGTFDAVVSTDALEHVEPAHLGNTLQMIGSKIERCGFFRIACYPAKKKLPDGRNAHLIVELPEWWRAKIEAEMGVRIVWEEISEFDKTDKWAWVKGHNYDIIVEKA
jgi:hypothetical protein